MTQLTGPKNCAECGSEFTHEIIAAGGSRQATVIIRGHLIPVPGLYRCTGCHEAVKAGMRVTGVTLESALEYLDEVYGPGMTAGVLQDGPHSGRAAVYLLEALEVSALLENIIHLRDETGGLDFVPECDGNCGAHDLREMAHLN